MLDEYAQAIGSLFTWSEVERWVGRVRLDHRLTSYLYHRDLPHGPCQACRYGYSGHAERVAEASRFVTDAG